MRRDKGLCQPCKEQQRVRRGTAVDHIVNKDRGGTDDPSNLRCICGPCHAAKTAREAVLARDR